MKCCVRDVYAKIGHVFEDTGMPDVKAQRDCLVTLISKEGHIYYLTLATHNHNVMEVYQMHKDSNYLMAKKKVDGLKETSLVNLRSIYKDDIGGKLVVVVPQDEYRKMIKKFIQWQNRNPHKLYEEIKPLLEEESI